jgi:hypothetical protein
LPIKRIEEEEYKELQILFPLSDSTLQGIRRNLFRGEDTRDIHHASQVTYLTKEKKVNKKNLMYFFVGHGKIKNTRYAVRIF